MTAEGKTNTITDFYMINLPVYQIKNYGTQHRQMLNLHTWATTRRNHNKKYDIIPPIPSKSLSTQHNANTTNYLVLYNIDAIAYKFLP
jgi:hypothetical protein